MAACCAALAALSRLTPLPSNPTGLGVAGYISIGIGAALFWIAARKDGAALWPIIGLGLLMRASLFVSEPVLEDDYHRYLWDGAVISAGISPYAYAPASASGIDALGRERDCAANDADLAVLCDLAAKPAARHGLINYPFLTTIYPPAAEAAFALAHKIQPFGLTGLRLVYLLADGVALWGIVRLLAHQGQSLGRAAWYWWNPALLFYGYGATHMDVLLAPFLVLALLAASRGRGIAAGALLAGGVLIKVWPLLLTPILLAALPRRPRVWVGFAVALCVGSAGLLLQLDGLGGPDADGLTAYAEGWRRHAFLFPLIEGALSWSPDSGLAARLLVAALVGLGTLYLAWRVADGQLRLPAACAASVAALVLLAPTGYPWYAIWLAPLLPFVRWPGLVALTLAVPLYQLRFVFGDDALIYQLVVVPLAFLPSVLLLASQGLRSAATSKARHVTA